MQCVTSDEVLKTIDSLMKVMTILESFRFKMVAGVIIGFGHGEFYIRQTEESRFGAFNDFLAACRVHFQGRLYETFL